MIPNQLPADMKKVIDELKKSKNKQQCLVKAYNILTSKYHGQKLGTIIYFYKFFIWDVNKLWRNEGFFHCTHLNHLLMILLVKSGFFTESEIKKKWTLIYYTSPHQYLKIKINSQESINVDPWGKVHGIKLGDYAHGFV